MKLFKALFLGFILVLFILVPVFADSARIAEIRSAIFESYLQASGLVTLSREAYLDAADAREAATNYSILAITALDSGRFADAIDYAILADDSEMLAEHFENEGQAILLLAEDEQRKIAELASEFSRINSTMAAENRDIARGLTEVIDSLMGIPEEVISEDANETTADVLVEDVVSEKATAIEEPEAPGEEVVAVLEPENWLVGSLVITEGEAIMDFQDYLRMYPFFVEVFEEEVIVTQEELGIRVDGTYIGPDEMGWVGFTPKTFVGISDDYVYEFFYLVEEFNVDLPEVYWFKGTIEGSMATLEAEGTIDGTDFHIVIGFLEQ